MRERWRRRGIVALVLYVIGMRWWAARPTTDSIPLLAPLGQPAAFAVYRCAAVLGPDQAPVATTPVPYPTDGTPCDGRATHRVLLVGDVALGLAGLVALRRRVTDDVDGALVEEAPTA